MRTCRKVHTGLAARGEAAHGATSAPVEMTDFWMRSARHCRVAVSIAAWKVAADFAMPAGFKRTCLLFLFAVALTAHGADAPLTFREAIARRDLRCEFTSDAPDQLKLCVTNSGAETVYIAIPTGAIVASAGDAGRQIVLRGAEISVAPANTSEALLPAALLSAKPATTGSARRFTDETEKRLDPLLKRLASEKDLPRATAQFAVFCIVEDMSFTGWQKFLTTLRGPVPDTETHPTPAEVAQAIDVLGLVTEVTPEREFALAKDGELRLRALRNPWCRAKAMQLFGIKVTDDGSEFGLPNMSQLLHTKPGDNCPFCRTRTEMQKGAGDF